MCLCYRCASEGPLIQWVFGDVPIDLCVVCDRFYEFIETVAPYVNVVRIDREVIIDG